MLPFLCWPAYTEITKETPVVEKVIRATDLSLKPLLREVKTLRSRQHSNIVPLLGSYTKYSQESEYDVRSVHLLLPKAEMNMSVWLNNPCKSRSWPLEACRSTELVQSSLYYTIFKLVTALAFLHREADGTVTSHHDLKPANILVFGREMKIADLGFSHLRSVADGSQTMGPQGSGFGTFEYNPPEYWDDTQPHYRAKKAHGRAFDVWAMGCVLLEVLLLIVYGLQSGKVREFREKRAQNRSKNIPKLVELCPGDEDRSFHNNMNVVQEWILQLKHNGNKKLNSVLDIVEKMLRPSPDERLSARDAELRLFDILSPDDDQIKSIAVKTSSISQPPVKATRDDTQTPPLREIHKVKEPGQTRAIDLIKQYSGISIKKVFGGNKKRTSSEKEELAPLNPGNGHQSSVALFCRRHKRTCVLLAGLIVIIFILTIVLPLWKAGKLKAVR